MYKGNKMKDLKISKELLSEVLNYEVDVFLGINKDEIDYTCCRDENEGYIDISINLYEFAFKCKEWAYKNFKIMLISQYTGQCYINGDLSPLSLNWWNDTKSYQVESNTEVEAIIIACEWILEGTK